MNIAFDATAMMAYMSKNRGIGIYTHSQFEKMMELDKDNQYYLFNMYEAPLRNDWEERFSNFHQYYRFSGKRIEVLRMAEYKDILGSMIKEFIRECDIDVFYITSPFDPGITVYEKDWFEGVKVVATVYDIIPYVFKEKFFTTYSYQKRYMEQVSMLKWVDKCLTISNSVKDDMVNYLGFDTDKIEVVGAAVDTDKFKKVALSDEERKAFLGKYGIQHEFILCVGGDDARKNVDGLIRAYAGLDAKIKEQYQLVIVCSMSQGTIKHLSNIIEDCNVVGRVVFTNYIDDDALIAMYNLAAALAFPSKYEGFGLPIVEAWNCGTAVLTSNNSSMCEVGGEASVLVDPYSIENITEGLEKILELETNAVLVEKGQERAKEYTWEKVAGKTINIINGLDKAEKKECIKRTIKKVAMFTPLPPIESGIAEYSVDIINALSSVVDVDVYIDNGYEHNCKLSDNVRVYRHYEFMERCQLYDEVIYQVGYTVAHHQYMYDYVKNFHGIVVLHDYNLHGSVREIVGDCKGSNCTRYKEFLMEDMSSVEADAFLYKTLANLPAGSIQAKELNGFITNYAKKIIVHSEFAKSKLMKKNPRYNVVKIPHYTKVNPLVKKEIEGDGFVFAAFGFMGESKRILQIVDAFSRLVTEGHNIKLLLVGKLAIECKKRLEKKINDYGIASLIDITGFTPIDVHRAYVDKVDACLNLRYPYIGETSGTLSLLLGKGKCTIVNKIGSFDEIPDEACIKIPSVENMSEDEEVNCIYNAMKKSLDNDYRNRVEESAYRYAQENLDIEKVKEMYIDAMSDDSEKSYSHKDIVRLLEMQ